MVDLVLIVDSSGSICDNDPTRVTDANGNPTNCNNWGFVRSFLRLILDELIIGENDAHIGLIRFSSQTSVIFGLNRLVVKCICPTMGIGFHSLTIKKAMKFKLIVLQIIENHMVLPHTCNSI